MDSKEVLAEQSKLFRENLPDVTKNFSDLCGTVFKDGKLSLKRIDSSCNRNYCKM